MKDSIFNMDINYTIIIPHKDIPDLLQRCLDSIPQRADVQVVVVDDNSDPDKVDFANFPGSDRADVECCFPKEGKGAGYARNVGLRHACGKWLLFADADDFFHPNLLEILDRWKDSTRDIIYFETDSVDSDTLEPIPPRLSLHPSAMVREEMVREEMVNRALWVVPWGKMIRAELVRKHDILFEEVCWSNDVMFSTLCSYYAGKNVDICSDLLYCATDRRNSLWTGVRSEEHIMCRLGVTLRAERFAYKHHLSLHRLPSGISLSFLHVSQMRELGKKAHRRAKIHYLKHACLHVLINDFIAVLKFRIKNR